MNDIITRDHSSSDDEVKIIPPNFNDTKTFVKMFATPIMQNDATIHIRLLIIGRFNIYFYDAITKDTIPLAIFFEPENQLVFFNAFKRKSWGLNDKRKLNLTPPWITRIYITFQKNSFMVVIDDIFQEEFKFRYPLAPVPMQIAFEGLVEVDSVELPHENSEDVSDDEVTEYEENGSEYQESEYEGDEEDFNNNGVPGYEEKHSNHESTDYQESEYDGDEEDINSNGVPDYEERHLNHESTDYQESEYDGDEEDINSNRVSDYLKRHSNHESTDNQKKIETTDHEKHMSHDENAGLEAQDSGRGVSEHEKEYQESDSSAFGETSESELPHFEGNDLEAYSPYHAEQRL